MAAFAKILSRLIRTDSALLVIGGAALWLAIIAGVRPLMLPDEGRYVGVAWEMVTSGNWLVPLLDGMPFFHKPPLFYWISALGLSLFGATEWAGRLASIFAGIVSAGALYLFIRRYRNSQVATVATVVLVTQPMFFAGAQFANLDMLVAGMISLTILSGADALFRREQKLPYLAAVLRTFALAALGLLAKGLIGIVLPGGVLFFWILWRRSWSSLRILFSPLGILVFLALGLPWFFWMQYVYPGFFDYFVVYHHFQRFSQTGFNNQMPIWFYVPVVLLCALPWSPWVARVFNRAYWTDREQGPLRSLMAIWLLVILIFFSLPSSKLVGYILPVLPPFAYFVAEPFAAWLERDRKRAKRWYVASIGLAMVICIALVVGLTLADKASARPLATSIQPAFKAADQIVMIDGYQYDLPFYLRSTKPSWVISNWLDPEIPQRDDWRKELFDAGKFDPATAQAVLLTPEKFTEQLCQHQSGSLWLWSKSGGTAALSWLEELPTVGKSAKHSLWQLTPEMIRKLPVCAEKPTGG